ncbi:tetratricopeptide repeat protein [Streptomyces exfoliatus]|uniref:tetratricopeptide repeat protein n=1 Tax=Streptomyces exfoliatus TaxID=1905 RepID=UPI000462FFF9|nr:tetratricopeptide repeat protein [Streptomyces exfoliatus]
MDVDLETLAWHAESNGGLHLRTVKVLLDHGQLEVVIRAAAERGEWVCAREAVRELCAAGEFGRAEGVMAPFMAIGWRPAVWETAGILVRAGRVEDAVALVSGAGDAEPRSAEDCRSLAELLAEAGRVDEAIELLAPRLEEDGTAYCLERVTEGQGRDERVLDLLPPAAASSRARVLERAGRVEEAARTLRDAIVVRDTVMVGTVKALAGLCLRHGRVEELRELATGRHATYAVRDYARALGERGRSGEAEALLRELIAEAEPYAEHYRWYLLELLCRQGRFGDAEEVARPTYGHEGHGLLESFVHVLVEAGRADLAVRHVEELDAAGVLDEESDWVLVNRVWLLGEAGRYEDALAYAATLPPEEQPYTNMTVSGVLERLGRVDEAVELLRTTEGASAWEPVEVLARHGRGAEGLAGMPSLAEEREERSRRYGW